MPDIKLSLIKGERVTDYDYRDSLPVNMIAVARGVKGDAGYMISHDGIDKLADVAGLCRGATFNERLNSQFRVNGDYLEEINPTGTVNQIGYTPGRNPVSFAESSSTQAVISDGNMWLYDGVSLKQVTDPQLGRPIDITWFSGIYVLTDGEFLYQTDITDETSISPLKYSSSEYSADPIKAVARNDQNQIIAFNRYTIEYFYFNANAPVGTSVLFPIQGRAAKIGIVGTKCQCQLDGAFYILGGRKEESPSIHILNGSQEATVATREIDKIISKYSESELESAYLESRTVDRDKFLIVHLPCETLIYNRTIAEKYGNDNAWSFVKSGGNNSDPWRGIYGVFDPRLSKWVYGDKQDAVIGTLNDQFAKQYEESAECICYTPIVPLSCISINELEISTIAGYAATDFTSAISISYDGVTYGKEYWNKISAVNNYGLRYIVRRVGFVRDEFSMRFRFISDKKMALGAVNVVYE